MSTATFPPGVRFESGYSRTKPSRPELGVAGLVGFAESGPVHEAVRIESWNEYRSVFGEFDVPGHLPYSVRLFFQNGGRSLYVVRVAVAEQEPNSSPFDQATRAFVDIPVVLGASRGTVRLKTNSVGHWGNRLEVTVTPEKKGQATLVVRDGSRIWRIPETTLRSQMNLGGSDAPVEVESPRYWAPKDIAATEIAKAFGVNVDDMLGSPVVAAGRAAILPWEAVEEADFDMQPAILMRGGRDGIANCRVHHLVGGDKSVLGVAALTDISEITLVAVPDAVPFAVTPMPGSPAPGLARCADLDAPDESRSYFRVKKDTAVSDLPIVVGTTTASLLAVNPQLEDLEVVEANSLIVVPQVVTADVDDVKIDPLDWDPSAGPEALLTSLDRLGERYGVSREELLKANPAYRPPAADSSHWRPSGIPVRIPAPEKESPPRWDLGDSERIHAGLIRFCEARQDCVALIDSPAADDEVEAIREYRERFDTSFAALYWPRLLVPGVGVDLVNVPSSGAIAGLTASRDRTTGPHHSPAGHALRGTTAVARVVSDSEHALLNDSGVNVLRQRAGRSVTLEGARSLSGDPALRFLSVRRTLLAIREALEVQTRWAVFERAAPGVWSAIQDQVRAYLRSIWRRGWLTGRVADEAFYVKCDASTNPESVQDRGMIVAEIGLRFPPPIEWIVVHVGRSASGLEVLDAA